jgi:hypothetical protein
VHLCSQLLVSAERERQIRNAATDLGARQVLLDQLAGLDEVHSIIVVLLYSERTSGTYKEQYRETELTATKKERERV